MDLDPKATQDHPCIAESDTGVAKPTTSRSVTPVEGQTTESGLTVRDIEPPAKHSDQEEESQQDDELYVPRHEVETRAASAQNLPGPGYSQDHSIGHDLLSETGIAEDAGEDDASLSSGPSDDDNSEFEPVDEHFDYNDDAEYGTTQNPAIAEASAANKANRPRPYRKQALNAQEKALERHGKEFESLKNYVKRIIQKKGRNITADDVPPPAPKRRRACKASAENKEEAQLDTVPNAGEPGANEVVVTKKRRLAEISHDQASEGLSNRRTNTQREDLKDAMALFGYGKVKSIEKGGEKLFRLYNVPVLLKPWQLVVVAWMVKRETGSKPPRGGVVADVPGFGKTVMSLSAIVGNPASQDEKRKARGATLIVLPNATVVKQWADLIQEHLGAVYYEETYIYRRSQNNLSPTQIGKFWVVLTSYHEVQRGWPSQDVQEALENKHMHGKATANGGKKLDQQAFDAEFQEYVDDLFRVNWYRVVLDEVHAIKNICSRTCRSAQNLRAQHFWGLSGTPLVNAAEELFPYLKIIGFSDAKDEKKYKAKYINAADAAEKVDALVSCYTYRRTHNDMFLGRKMLDLPVSHPGDQWVSLSKEERILYEATSKHYFGRGRRMMAVMLHRQRQLVSHPYLIERFLRTQKPLELIETYLTELQGVEGNHSMYSQIGSWAQRHAHSRYNATSQPCFGLARLNPFGKSGFGGKIGISRYLELVQNQVLLETSRCGNRHCQRPLPLMPRMIIGCKHLFCFDCIESYINTIVVNNTPAQCPACDAGSVWKGYQPLDTLGTDEQKELMEKANAPRKKRPKTIRGGRKSTNSKLSHETVPQRRPGDDFLGVQPSLGEDDGGFLRRAFKNAGGIPTPSAKITAAKDTILRWLKDDPNHQGIIFTQFIGTLLVTGRMLQLEGVEFVYLTGKMTAKEKITAIQTFRDNPTVKYLVASMRCGGQSLNLTNANRVILIDIWWNQAAEEQAFGRVFRLGQIQETHYVRILARDTVDETIKDKQSGKCRAIDRTLQDDKHVVQVRSELQSLALLEPRHYHQIVQQALDAVLAELSEEGTDADA